MGFRDLWRDDLKRVIEMDEPFVPVKIRRMTDNTEGYLPCAMTLDKDEMLLQNYRLFEVNGGEGLYLDNRKLTCLRDDWFDLFDAEPISKQKYVLDGHMFEIRNVSDNLGVFYVIRLASLET